MLPRNRREATTLAKFTRKPKYGVTSLSVDRRCARIVVRGGPFNGFRQRGRSLAALFTGIRNIAATRRRVALQSAGFHSQLSALVNRCAREPKGKRCEGNSQDNTELFQRSLWLRHPEHGNHKYDVRPNDKNRLNQGSRCYRP